MRFKRSIVALTLATFVFSSSGCGVLLYPERQGQTSGDIDPVVAILNGVGLLLYIIPGLVAFAVDFHQGTIYLPNTSASLDSDGELRAVEVEGPMTQENIEATLRKELGQNVDISASNVRAHSIGHGTQGLVPAMARASSERYTL